MWRYQYLSVYADDEVALKDFYVRHKSFRLAQPRLWLLLILSIPIGLTLPPIFFFVIFSLGVFTFYLIIIIGLMHISSAFRLLQIGTSFDELELNMLYKYDSYIKALKNTDSHKDIKTNKDIEEVHLDPEIPKLSKKIDLTRPIRTNTSVKSNKISNPPPVGIAEDDFLGQLIKYIDQHKLVLSRRNQHILQHILDVFKEIHRIQNTSKINQQNKNDLQKLQKNCIQSIREHSQTYRDTPSHNHIRYQSDLKAIPDMWLYTQLQQQLEHLIQYITFLYENDLQRLSDHQKFLKQRFQSKEDEFMIQNNREIRDE